MTCFFGSDHDGALRPWLGVVLVRAEVECACPGRRARSRSRASRAAACPTRRGRRPACRCPGRPWRRPRLWAMSVHQFDRVLAGPARGVVVVRQAEVVAVLVGEDVRAAVLGLDRVVADPQAGVADLGTAALVRRRARRPVVLEGVPAVAPDGVLALLRVAVGLVATGVDDLEVVDVAVGLVEVAVTVEVVAVPLVVRRQVGLDLVVGAALGLLVGDPRDRARRRSGSCVLEQTLPAQG